MGVNQAERLQSREPEQAMQPPDVVQQLQEIHRASYGWALACCAGNRHEAEEVLQTSYLKAMEGRARFNGHSGVRTWFFGVVLRTAAEQRRQQRVRRLALGRWFARRVPAEGVASPERLSSEVEAGERLRVVLASLSRRQREVLHLVFYQELTIEEAADVLHVPVGTARTHYQRGKARLKELLSATGGS
jgi:RNA polymerase sigma-70 factor (ECF subfamily)